MAASPLPDATEYPFASYVAELRELFSTSHLPFGSPQDLFPTVEQVTRPGHLSDDVNSLVRSFVLREGGALPNGQLLEILSTAIGGPELRLSPVGYEQPLRQLAAFLAATMRRPWNVPPNVPGEVVPFPAEAAGPKRAAFEQPEPVPVPLPVAEPLAARDDSPAAPSRWGGMWAAGVAVAALAVCAAAFVSLHRTSSTPETFHVEPVPVSPLQQRALPDMGSQPPVAATPSGSVAESSLHQNSPDAAHPAKPSAYGERLRLRSASGVASQPYRAAISSTQSSSASGQTAVSGSAQRASAGSGSAMVYAPYNPTDQTQTPATQPAAPIVRRPVTVDPDSYIAGDMPQGVPSRPAPSYFTVSSGVMAANLISSVEPDYPLLARLAHVQGEVTLLAVVAKDGSVEVTRVLRGNRLLRSAAQDAVRQFRYRPYRIDGQPVEVATVVTVAFHDQD